MGIGHHNMKGGKQVKSAFICTSRIITLPCHVLLIVRRYLGIASGIEVLDLILVVGLYTFFALGSLRASRYLHQRLTKSILTCTLRYSTYYLGFPVSEKH